MKLLVRLIGQLQKTWSKEMILVIDTNILLASLIRDATTRKIIVESDWKFYYPEVSFHEVRKYKDLVLEKS